MPITPEEFSSSGAMNPAAFATEITPADTDLDEYTRALYVGGAGNVTVLTAGGDTVTFVGVVGSTILPIRCRQVKAATTATNIIGLR